MKDSLRKIDLIKNCRVIFHGHVESRIDLNNILRKVDVLLFLSKSEGSPRVVLECMANSVLCVTTPVGSLPQTFKDGSEIIFVDGDNKSIADAIAKVYENKKLSLRIIHSAYKLVFNTYTSDNFFKGLLDE